MLFPKSNDILNTKIQTTKAINYYQIYELFIIYRLWWSKWKGVKDEKMKRWNVTISTRTQNLSSKYNVTWVIARRIRIIIFTSTIVWNLYKNCGDKLLELMFLWNWQRKYSIIMIIAIQKLLQNMMKMYYLKYILHLKRN